MSENTTNAIISVGDLTKPADTLINKISEAVGGVFAPYQIKRIAKAEAEAALIKAQTEIQVSDLHRRAMHRFVEEEAVKQRNIESITAKTLPQLTDKADPNAMENDWVTNFFDKSRIVSDSDMQDLWSRVLAGEANAPGTYSKRTVNFLSDLDKNDAKLFSSLCGYGWMIDGIFIPLIFDTQAKMYNDNSIHFNSLSHLESIGLVQFQFVAGFKREKVPKSVFASYCGDAIELVFDKEEGNDLPVGKVLLTKVGHELAPISGGEFVEGFQGYVKDKWKRFLPQLGDPAST